MSDTTIDSREPYVTLKNGPMDGIAIPQNAKDCIMDGVYVGPGPYHPRYRVKTGSIPQIAEFEGYLR
jgi:hypothetical protein